MIVFSTSEYSDNICEGLTEENLVNFVEAYIDINKITNITKFRSLKSRLLQRRLGTTIQLKEWNYKDNDECSFGTAQRETALHLLVLVLMTGQRSTPKQIKSLLLMI